MAHFLITRMKYNKAYTFPYLMTSLPHICFTQWFLILGFHHHHSPFLPKQAVGNHCHLQIEDSITNIRVNCWNSFMLEHFSLFPLSACLLNTAFLLKNATVTQHRLSFLWHPVHNHPH